MIKPEFNHNTPYPDWGSFIYRGHTVEIRHDEYAENPFEDWDVLPPMIAKYGRHEAEYGDYEIDKTIIQTLTDEQIRENASDIADVLVCDLMAIARDYADDCRPLKRGWMVGVLRDILHDAGLNHETREMLADIAGIPCLNTRAIGYGQGEYSELFLIALPEWFEYIGLGKSRTEADIMRQMESAATLYESWAFGDVYTAECEALEIHIGSFYGSDHNESGLVSEITDEIDYCMAQEKARHFAKLKQAIKSGVPIQYRTAFQQAS